MEKRRRPDASEFFRATASKSNLDYSVLGCTLPAFEIDGVMQKSVFSPQYTAFLKQLREARQRAGLSQEELAERLEQTQSFVSKCERGERRIDVIELRQFCLALGVSFSQFAKQLDSALAE